MKERDHKEELDSTTSQNIARILELALAAGNLGDWSWAVSSDTVKLGARSAAILGLSAADSVSVKELRELLHPEDREHARLTVMRSLRESVPYDVEYRLQRPNGEEAWIAVKGRALHAADGSLLGMHGVAQDVTERRTLDLAQRRMAAIVESSDDAIISKDLDGTLRTWNHAAERIFGYTEAEVVGRSIMMLIPPELQEEELRILARLRNGERVDHYETVRLTKDGQRLDLSLTVSPIRDSSGRVVGASKVARDITARKQVEAELRRNEEDLRKAARERQILLEAERPARGEAERVSLMKEEFLATLSHELRTPLNAIVGWSQVLRSRATLDPESLEGLAIIDRNAKLQAQLIEDLLDMSRINSGKLRLEVERVDLLDVVKAAIASVRHAADSKSLQLQGALDPFVGPVWGDPRRLQQCIGNLLSNAIKFTPRSGRIEISLARLGSNVAVTVADNGQGIAPEFLPHVFERFRQADASTTRFHAGLGLGLSIVKSIMEMHGGRVSGTSAGLGKGASFQLELPVMVVEDPKWQRPLRNSESGAAMPAGSSLRGITVLAVDDEPDARVLIKRILEDCGARVLVADSAPHALSVIKEEHPDVLLSDLSMPAEDGYALIRKVRSLDRDEGGEIPAAALSALARPEDRALALEAGYQAHLSKPVQPTELSNLVATLARPS